MFADALWDLFREALVVCMQFVHHVVNCRLTVITDLESMIRTSRLRCFLHLASV
jgi:hypothetical protein